MLFLFCLSVKSTKVEVYGWFKLDKFTSFVVKNLNYWYVYVLLQRKEAKKDKDAASGRVLAAAYADLPAPELEWEKRATAPVPRLDGAALQIKNLLFVFAGYGTIDHVRTIFRSWVWIFHIYLEIIDLSTIQVIGVIDTFHYRLFCVFMCLDLSQLDKPHIGLLMVELSIMKLCYIF